MKDPKYVLADIELLRPQEGDVLVLRNMHLEPDALATLAAAVPGPCLLVEVEGDQQLEHLDREAMRRHGWIRADEAWTYCPPDDAEIDQAALEVEPWSAPGSVTVDFGPHVDPETVGRLAAAHAEILQRHVRQEDTAAGWADPTSDPLAEVLAAADQARERQ